MVNEIMNNVSQQIMRGEKVTQSKEFIYLYKRKVLSKDC